MEKRKILAAFAAVAAACGSFAEPKQYFGVNNFDEHTDAPVQTGSEYYDDSLGGGHFHELTFQEWFNAPHALANMYGARRYAENNGIVPTSAYLGNFASNVSGGMSRGASNTSSVNLGLGIDLRKLTGVESLDGWTIGNAWAWRFGDSITKNRIGNAFNVQQNYGSQTLNLQSLFAAYNRDFLSDWHLTFKLGRFAAGDNFMSKPIYWLYQNNAFDGNPVGAFKQTKLSAYPGSTWAAYVQVEHKNGAYAKSGVYKINTAKQDDMHGLDWSFNGGGVNANFEIGRDFNHDGSGKSPANISAGVIASWYNAPHIDNPSKFSHFNCSVYVQADYMVYNMGPVKADEPYYIVREEDKWRDLRGLILWGAFQYDPYENLADMPIFVNGGVLFNAPFESRADDVLCFGVAYGKFSDKYTGDIRGSYEAVFELNYKFQINKFSFVQPNVQYVLNTGGGKYGDAVVLGLQFGLNL